MYKEIFETNEDWSNEFPELTRLSDDDIEESG
jgi:hypothetical protein